jgi:Cyclic nucleotide-binding domain
MRQDDVPTTATAAAAGTAGAALLTPRDRAVAAALPADGVMFRRADARALDLLAREMHERRFSRGDDIVVQDAPSDRFWVIAEGTALRLRTDANGTTHHVDAAACGTTINSLQLVPNEPVYATARCTSETCRAFGMRRDTFIAHLSSHPDLALGIISGLSHDARAKTKLFRTPLLHQHTPSVSYSAVTIAAAVESYYRSALNSLINHSLTGNRSPYFPNMHIQVPARVLYINGFKGIRAFLDQNFHSDTHPQSNSVRLATMVGPGIIMTPVSSFLEACNAGHTNPEPMFQRSLRGTLPRCAREVIFGIGINPLSEYFEERYRTLSPGLELASNPLLTNMAGSVTAGVIAGYLSHVPHNISTLKLLEPGKSYRELFAKFVSKSAPIHLIPRGLPDVLVPPVRIALACIFPRGVVVRTAQIVGSFAILNGGIQLLHSADKQRLWKAMAAYDDLP